MKEEINEVVKRLVSARKVAVLTGAGISAESGIPTFRGKGGLWRNYNPTELATPDAFNKDPKLVWEFYNWRRQIISKASFNEAHRALARMEEMIPEFTLITQNVDGLHQLAGSKYIIELHGNIWEVKCTVCEGIYLDRSPDLGPMPRCRNCQGLLRPNVVWFGESLDYNILREAFEISGNSEVMFSIGTSGVVQPAASLTLEAKRHGAFLVEINPEPTPQTHIMDISFQNRAGEILPEIVNLMSCQIQT